jgi:predicted CXXCH cytochrome family protein
MKMLSTIVAVIALVAVLLLDAGPAYAQSGFRSGFDHFTTGFPLDGSHRNTDCERCHVGGIFRGTPRKCSACHARAGLVRSTPVPVDHILSTPLCEDCHWQTNWDPVRRVDHSQVIGSCSSCHNGTSGTGKPLDHPPSSDQCEDCHRPNGWLPAGFDHANVSGNCFSCHNGTTATGKNTMHINTTNVCEDCHRTIAWVPVIRVDHLQVLGLCQTCHDGTTATGKDTDHVPSGDACDDCHSTNAWLPAIFNHTSPAYPGDHSRPLACTDCHGGNTEVVTWPFAAYQPDCAGCHAGNYKAGPHKKHENPDVLYTVGELRDCSGACHVYTDATLTTISQSRPGPKHRVSDGGF